MSGQGLPPYSTFRTDSKVSCYIVVLGSFLVLDPIAFVEGKCRATEFRRRSTFRRGRGAGNERLAGVLNCCYLSPCSVGIRTLYPPFYKDHSSGRPASLVDAPRNHTDVDLALLTSSSKSHALDYVMAESDLFVVFARSPLRSPRLANFFILVCFLQLTSYDCARPSSTILTVLLLLTRSHLQQMMFPQATSHGVSTTMKNLSRRSTYLGENPTKSKD